MNFADPTGLQEVIVGPCPAGQCVVTVYGSVGGLFGGGGGSLGSTQHPPLLDGPELSPDGGGGGGGGAPAPLQGLASQPHPAPSVRPQQKEFDDCVKRAI